MTNYKEILRLYKTGDYSQRDIAVSLHVSRNTVAGCIKKFEDLHLSMYDINQMSDEEVSELMTRKEEERTPSSATHVIPDFEAMINELKKPHVTKKLLWTEYTAECKDTGLKPYSISQFNSLFSEFLESRNLSMNRKHIPGEVLELD